MRDRQTLIQQILDEIYVWRAANRRVEDMPPFHVYPDEWTELAAIIAKNLVLDGSPVTTANLKRFMQRTLRVIPRPTSKPATSA